MSALPMIDRAAVNRANPQHSTGPQTLECKARSSQNALRHHLSSRTALLESEGHAAYQQHCRQFFDIDKSRAFDYSRTYEARKLFGAMLAGK